ncbi:MAG: hypothetical protein ACXVXP_05675 [Mycobacteriaceae bacterium]
MPGKTWVTWEEIFEPATSDHIRQQGWVRCSRPVIWWGGSVRVSVLAGSDSMFPADVFGLS